MFDGEPLKASLLNWSDVIKGFEILQDNSGDAEDCLVQKYYEWLRQGAQV